MKIRLAFGLAAVAFIAAALEVSAAGDVAAPAALPAAAPLSQSAYLAVVRNSSVAVLAGAGDVASCDSYGDEATAALLDAIPGSIFADGDNAYYHGSAAEFAGCYQPSWGRFTARTRPAAGNHDYVTPGAADYYSYFGPAAGPAGLGYYSYDLATWHIVVLNSNCGDVPGGCAAGSPQELWLRADLAAHPGACTLAYWHHPLFSSGEHGGQPQVQAFWQALYDYHAELVLNGHDHDYERFAPQNAAGTYDPAGPREFVLGTGGIPMRPFGTIVPNSEARNNQAWGVLRLTLRESGYDWQFVPVAGQSYSDAGSAACH